MHQGGIEYQLSQLPKPWLAKLHQAAIELDEEQMSQQFVEITSDYPYLSTHLTKLFQNLQFDHIVNLTQAALQIKKR